MHLKSLGHGCNSRLPIWSLSLFFLPIPSLVYLEEVWIFEPRMSRLLFCPVVQRDVVNELVSPCTCELSDICVNAHVYFTCRFFHSMPVLSQWMLHCVYFSIYYVWFILVRSYCLFMSQVDSFQLAALKSHCCSILLSLRLQTDFWKCSDFRWGIFI